MIIIEMNPSYILCFTRAAYNLARAVAEHRFMHVHSSWFLHYGACVDCQHDWTWKICFKRWYNYETQGKRNDDYLSFAWKL